MSEPTPKSGRIGWRGWLTISGSGLLVILALGLFWLFYTESGLRWAVSQAQGQVPGELSVGNVSGQLAGPLELEGLRFRDGEGLDVQADTLQLEWRLGLLLMGILQLDDVVFDGLVVALPPGEADTETLPIELPERISLPLRVNVRALTVNRIQLQPDGAEPIQLAELSASGHLARTELSLEQVTARADWLDLDAALSLDMRDDWPLELQADWQLRWPDLPEMQGHTALSGTPDTLDIEQSISGPLTLNLDGRVRQALTDPSVQLNLQFRDFEPARWFDEAPAGALAGRYRLDGNLAQARLQGRLDASDTPWGDWIIDSDVSGDSELTELRIRELLLNHQQHDQWLEMEGWAREILSEDPQVQLDLAWANLRWPLDEAEYESEAGQARLAGRQSDFSLTLDSAFRLNQAAEPLTRPVEGQIETRLTGQQDEAAIESLALTLSDGQSLNFQGDINWSESDPFLAGDFQFQALDPALLDEDWPGQLSGAGHLQARWQDAVTGSLDLESLDGQLVGQAVSAQGGVDYQSETITLRDVRASLGDNEVTASGRLATDLRQASSNLVFSVAVPDVSQLPLEAQGRLQASGEVRGSLESLDLRLALEANELAYEDYQLGSMKLDLNLQEGWEADSEIRLELQELSINEETISRLLIRGDGQRSDHRLSLQAEHPTLNLGVSFAGGLNADWLDDWQWQGEWVDTRLHNPVAGRWQQRSPRPLSLSAAGGELDRLCLDPVDGVGDLCLSGQTDQEGHWTAAVRGEGFPLAMLVDPEETGINVQGSINLTAEAEDRGEGLRAQGQLDFTPGLISQRVDGQDMTLLAIDGGRSEFHWTPESAQADMDLALSEGGFLRGRAQLPQGLDGPLDGRLDAEIPQLGLLPLLLAEIGRAEGLLALGVDIGGTLADPDFSGEVRVVDAVLNFPDLGITAEAVDVFLTGSMEQLRLDASAQSGGGDLQFRAELDRIEDDWVGEASLEGERFLILSIPDARVRINPALEITASAGRRLDVGGELHVPFARITPGEFQAAVQPSQDEVIISELRPMESEDELGGWAIHSRVRASLGDDVEFDGFGLTGRITGALNVRDEPNALTRATGELEVREGQYTAWRQQLEIERGRLFFSNTPINDPALDIRAVRRPRNVVVGVNIRGTLREPQLELFSDPAMQQSEQLSYLLTGRSLTEGGEGDMNLVREAALALQVAGGGYVGRQLGDRLGVDTVTIEAGDTPEETSVVFGEYISPRLFISYGIGLFEGTNVFRMRYEISSRWFLEAQTGPRSGADFIYNLERG
ncbi:translocation and assembly module TamB [Natronospira proteinivora]|uniref:Translocation and assembly module TamB n=1 Tax=Natronospira proteinivora TaxID=1807133 RepID=A0ABT1GA99_9GAMM|nr:translocation/assembly module TamB domain-containing protein [Natronospira proteinivora]MCP1728255.1 translocation and assembly module TamB [Natronospira proteinivora]